MRSEAASRTSLATLVAIGLVAPLCALLATRLPELRGRDAALLLGGLGAITVFGASLSAGRSRRGYGSGLRGLLLLGYFALAPIAFGKYLTEKAEVFVSTLGVAIWAPDLILLGIVAICVLFLPPRQPRALRWTLRAFTPLLGFVVLQAVVAPFSREPAFGLYEIVKYGTALALCVALVRVLEKQDLPYVAAGLLFGALVQSAMAIGQYYRGWTFGQELFGQSAGVLVGTFGDAATVRVTGLLGFPNALGSFLVMVLPVAAALLVTPQRVVVRAASALTLVLGVAALVFTFSRGAWLAFAVACLLVVAQELRRRTARQQLRLITAGVMLTLAACGVVYVLYGDEILARLQRSPAESLAIRSQLAWAALRVFGEHPLLGVGPNVFPLELLGTHESEAVAPAHNLYLLLLAEAGLAGTAFFLTQLARCLRPPRRMALGAQPALSETIQLGLWAGLLGFFLHQLVDITYIMPAIFRMTWLVATLCLFLQHPPDEARP